MIHLNDLRDVVARSDPRDNERFRRSREQTLRLLDAGVPALRRDHYLPGHITGSAIVLSDDRSHVLLIHHRRLGRWLQPGGHVEPEDESVLGAALREVKEETGVDAVADKLPVIVGVDVHEIPASGREPAHLHYDVVWRLVAPRMLPGGVERAEWCRVDEIEKYGADDALLAAIRRAMDGP